MRAWRALLGSNVIAIARSRDLIIRRSEDITLPGRKKGVLPLPIRLCRQMAVVARHAWACGFVEGGLELARPVVLLRVEMPGNEHWKYCGGCVSRSM